MLSTLKTLMGYFVSLLERHTPLELDRNSLDGIYNYLKIDENLATSGQPTAKQFAVIQETGYQLVINLAPNGLIENSLEDEEALVNGLGMNYVHLPVDFKNPTIENFDRFVEHLQNAAGKKIWVHCAANARVSAFVYKYRRDVLAVDPSTARIDLEKIWQPVGVWNRFLAEAWERR